MNRKVNFKILIIFPIIILLLVSSFFVYKKLRKYGESYVAKKNIIKITENMLYEMLFGKSFVHEKSIDIKGCLVNINVYDDEYNLLCKVNQFKKNDFRENSIGSTHWQLNDLSYAIWVGIQANKTYWIEIICEETGIIKYSLSEQDVHNNNLLKVNFKEISVKKGEILYTRILSGSNQPFDYALYRINSFKGILPDEAVKKGEQIPKLSVNIAINGYDIVTDDISNLLWRFSFW